MDRRAIHGCLLMTLLLLEGVCGAVLLPVIKSPTPDKQVKMPYISPQELDNAFGRAKSTCNKRADNDEAMPSKGQIIPKGSQSSIARHQRFTAIRQKVMDINDNQELFEQASYELVQKYGLNKEQAAVGLGQMDMPRGSNRAQDAIQNCQNMFSTGACDPDYKFRTPDGSCNNLQNPLWGKSETCFQRLIRADYADGFSLPRVALSGRPLPNPRVISTFIHNDRDIPAVDFTLMLMQWGQFMDHDMTLTPMTRAGNGMNMIQCCPFNPQRPNHPECFPIELPPDDDFFARRSQDCLNFVRSATCSDCKLGPRKQTNQLTAFIDASNVYGSTANDSRALREGRGGRLKFQNSRVGPLLPQSFDVNNDQCSRPQQGDFCFQAGDERVNEQPGLTSMHTVWLRQHNRIAQYLQRLYPRASDEDVYQETRRVVGAQLQHITYGEFLPVLLGPNYTDYFHLMPLGSGFTQYDKETEPTIVHEFSTAAYRTGHTFIQNFFQEYDGNFDNVGALRLQDNFFFPFTVANGEFEPILRGLFNSPAQSFDRHVVEDVTNHLYRAREENFGMDLPALNLQRGRDHGLNGYTKYIDYCFNIKINSFSDLQRFMSQDNANKLERIYESVHDIELFTGGVCEYPVDGGVVGPTFACIIGLQFYHLKFGDRFFYEHRGQSGSFTPYQLNTIRKTTLAKVICANSAVRHISANVFRPTTYKTPCDDLPELNLDLW